MFAHRNSSRSVFKANFLIPLGICLIAGSLWIWGFNTSYFSRRDAFDYGQLTAEFSQGHGFSSLQIFPRHIPYLHEKRLLEADHWPNLYRSPLVALIAAMFNRFFDSLTFSLICQSGFWYLASIPLIFLIASKVSNLKVAIASGAFFVADPSVILYSYSGMTETLGIFLTLTLVYLALQTDSCLRNWFMLGVVSGLAYLGRTQFIVFLPLVLVYAWLHADRMLRVKALALIILGVILPLAPWMIRNYSLVRDPLFSFTTSRNLVLDAIPQNSDLEMQLHAPTHLTEVWREYGQAILAKFGRNIQQNIFSLAHWVLAFRGLNPVLLLLFMTALIGWRWNYSTEQKLLKWMTISSLSVTFLLICLTVFSTRYYLAFHPIIILLGMAWLFFLLDRFSLAATSQMGILVGIMIIAGLQFFHAIQVHKNTPSVLSEFDQDAYTQVMRIVPPNALVAADISERISFFTGLRTLRLPANPAELLEIDRNYLPVDYVLVSKELNEGGTGDPSEPGYHETYNAYIPFLESKQFLDRYSFKRQLANGAVLFQRVTLKP